MITIFNRKEIFSTYSTTKYFEVKAKLRASSLEFKLKIIDRKNASSFYAQTTKRKNYEYRFYVHKDDYETAMALLS